MLRFSVPNMACGGCAKSVTSAIQSVDPAALVETDTARRIIRVTSVAHEGALLGALEDAGYPAEPMVEPIG